MTVTSRISKPAFGLILLAVSMTALVGCRGHKAKPSPDSAMVRLINAVPDTNSLTFSVGSVRVWERAGYRSNSGYQSVNEGSYHLGVSTDKQSEPLIGQLPLHLVRTHAYTVLTLGEVNGVAHPMQTRVFADDFSEPVPSDKIKIRFINACPSAGSVDVVFDNIVGLSDVAFGNRSEPVLLDAGRYYAVKLIAAGGGPEPIVGPIAIQMDAGHSYTLVSMGQANVRNLSLEAYKDD